jgi:hypothetical protein
MGVLEHLGIAQAPVWFSAAELREDPVLRSISKRPLHCAQFNRCPAPQVDK